MKIAIRKGVFETNSSSTHSFTICKNDKKIEDSYYVQIVSAEEKIVWMLSMLANAEEVYNYPCNIEMRKENEQWIRQRALQDLKDFKIDLKEWGYESEEEFAQRAVEDYEDSKVEMLRLKDQMIDYYCKQKNITQDEALKRFERLNGYGPENSDKMRYKAGEKLKYGRGNEFCCCRYFDEGALIDCFCGYEDYDAMSYSFNKIKKSFESWEKFIEWFLSEECKIVAEEVF